jgi:hypothetical protein
VPELINSGQQREKIRRGKQSHLTPVARSKSTVPVTWFCESKSRDARPASQPRFYLDCRRGFTIFHGAH